MPLDKSLESDTELDRQIDKVLKELAYSTHDCPSGEDCWCEQVIYRPVAEAKAQIKQLIVAAEKKAWADGHYAGFQAQADKEQG